jgi:hypothetical protein
MSPTQSLVQTRALEASKYTLTDANVDRSRSHLTETLAIIESCLTFEESHNGFMTEHVRYFGLHIAYKACISFTGLAPKLRGEGVWPYNDREKSNLAPRPKPCISSRSECPVPRQDFSLASKPPADWVCKAALHIYQARTFSRS